MSTAVKSASMATILKTMNARSVKSLVVPSAPRLTSASNVHQTSLRSKRTALVNVISRMESSRTCQLIGTGPVSVKTDIGSLNLDARHVMSSSLAASSAVKQL